MSRIHLSPPDVGPIERALLLDAFDSNWVAPLGPHVDAFEAEVAALVGVADAAALSSGTAGLHLALLLAGIGPGDEVLVPSLTFVASANVVRLVGAEPVFIDAGPTDWCVDPNLVADELDAGAARGRPAQAIITVDLYGQCADHAAIVDAAHDRDCVVIEDAAEAIGASRGGTNAGAGGDLGVFSFNGNKALTTGGGGMLVADDADLMARARFLASQARESVPWYEHNEAGFNYRLSNLLAAVGRGQLQRLPAMTERRAQTEQRYRSHFGDWPGIGFIPHPPDAVSNHWLTVMTLDPATTGATPEAIRVALEHHDIEARQAWKPMHLQPLFADARVRGGTVAESVFNRGLALPSGSALSDGDLDRVIAALDDALSSARP